MTSKRDKERGERREADSRERATGAGENEGEGLSNSTQRAKWIHSIDEHEDRPGQTLATRNHDVICRWAEERRANPATMSSTEHGGRAGVLRFDFPGFGGENLEEIEWDEWFKPFDERRLVFLYQEHKASGEPSNFFRLDNLNREDA
ncbi:hypothetical protein OV203_16365 [Nannocystis sp. ILAH1]|uniref:hypothetical protein n=1 Tax=unclassified Nannocystis TaxID=2627009 RepID=UPI00226D6629|nr:MULTISPECIES: hypothetical protein [unclassified Nannocystis]MCY0988710.1 hypothetical protein [Nannocystis sp. ILAH1]MCY1072487.1 hypothetical protein [Nannocystis sp. RBIL2]